MPDERAGGPRRLPRPRAQRRDRTGAVHRRVRGHRRPHPAAFIAALGAYGYATRRDLSSWARPLFWALLALIGFGIVAIVVAIPGANLIYASS